MRQSFVERILSVIVLFVFNCTSLVRHLFGNTDFHADDDDDRFSTGKLHVHQFTSLFAKNTLFSVHRHGFKIVFRRSHTLEKCAHTHFTIGEGTWCIQIANKSVLLKRMQSTT